MSSAITQVERDDYDVIVKAFKNEPVRLRAIGTRGHAIEVAGSDRTKSIGFPADCVYRLDNRLYKQLRTAFDAGDEQRLAKLWEQAHRFTGVPA